MKILVTGFDLFNGEPTNPSIEAVKRLPDTIADAEIVKVTVPTIFVRSAALVRQAILDEQPDVVLSIGQAGGRSAITARANNCTVKPDRLSHCSTAVRMLASSSTTITEFNIQAPGHGAGSGSGVHHRAGFRPAAGHRPRGRCRRKWPAPGPGLRPPAWW